MSNKKRRNRKFISDSSEVSGQIVDQSSEEVGIMDSEIQSVHSNSSGRNRLISYLKSNLWMVGIICFLALGVLGAGLKYLDDDAQREITRRADNKGKPNNQQEQSYILNRINPFLPAPTPSPTPQLSKEYLYAGSRLLAVEDANANAAPPADLAIWRPANGEWWVMGQQGSQQVTQAWGANGDDPVEGDYDGDGKTDFAVFRPSNANWYIVNSGGGGGQFAFGASGDLAAPADFDGDGRTDAAIFRPGNGTWYIQQSSTGQTATVQFGQNGDKPAPADYDGDGKADIGVWRSSQTAFYSLNSSNNALQTPTFGQTGDKVISGDYDGDGRADYAVYNSATANWYILQSTNGQVVGHQWGAGGDIAVQNDYDGDGKCDIAVWRNADGNWLIRQSASGNSLRQVQWGVSGDIPVPAFFRR